MLVHISFLQQDLYGVHSTRSTIKVSPSIFVISLTYFVSFASTHSNVKIFVRTAQDQFNILQSLRTFLCWKWINLQSNDSIDDDVGDDQSQWPSSVHVFETFILKLSPRTEDNHFFFFFGISLCPSDTIWRTSLYLSPSFIPKLSSQTSQAHAQYYTATIYYFLRCEWWQSSTTLWQSKVRVFSASSSSS